MKEVNISEINLSKLRHLHPKIHSEAEIYTDGKTLYKMYKDKSKKASYERDKKLEELGKIKGLKKVVIPKCKIEEKSKNKTILGCTLDYIPSSKTLFESVSLLTMNNYDEYLNLLRRVSYTLKSIHNRPENIVVGDMSFFNILIDNKKDYHIIDFDGVAIKNIRNTRVPYYVYEFIENKKVIEKVNRNYDRLTMLLFYLDSIFCKRIFEIKQYEYDRMSEQITNLKEIRGLFRELQRKGRDIPHIPYLYEIIESKRLNLTKNKKNTKKD